MRSWLLATLLFALGSPALADATLTVDTAYDPLAASPIRVSGAAPGEVLTLVTVRKLTVWRQGTDGQWGPQSVPFIGWAEIKADRAGNVDIASAIPLSGSYDMADPLGLSWSAYPVDNPAVPAMYRDLVQVEDSQFAVRLLRKNAVIASAEMSLKSPVSNLRFATVQQVGLVGVYASPKNAKGLPTLIVLHGSEGGSIEKAKANAALYARQGFATLAIAYYAQSYEATEFVASSGIEIDVNQLERARDWLGNQAEADIRRIGVWGQSKGGEFTMIAASRFPWVKAAVGCVPSDIIWQGFGEGENVPPARSTWMLDGKPMPFVPLYPYVEGRYRENTDRYERSRRFNAEAAVSARIPIEKTKAKLLLIGSDRDEVWASGAMARNIAKTMSEAGKARQVETLVFPTAGHPICGDGGFPVRAYGKDETDPDRKSLNAEGHAAMQAFRRTIAFLKSAL